MPKRLIITFDGTWNTPANDGDALEVETNACRISDTIMDKGEDGLTQIKWYDEGVGTEWYRRVRGGAFGLGLSENIRQGYRFLAENYDDGDEIFIFGFSRGAYTARSLVGMLRNCGLLHKAHVDQVEAAYEIYRARDEGPDSETAKFFRRTYGRLVEIKFLGVWDTVGALGVPLESFQWFNRQQYAFHDTELSSIVKHAYHAVASDEHRKPYDVTLWRPNNSSGSQVMEQRWFIGSHTDVGGGRPDRTLSDITLRWMQLKAQACGLGIDPDQIPAEEESSYLGVIRDSFQDFLGGLFSLFTGRFYRQAGQAHYGNESIDETILRRLKEDTDYRPNNIKAWLGRLTQDDD